jgi:predicted nucleotidyltransferase
VTSDHEVLIEALQRAGAMLSDVDVLVLFGSRARGTARANSDADIAVGLRGHDSGTKRTVEVALARAVNATLDVIFLDAAPPQLRFEMARSGRLIFERTEGAWARERARAMLDWWDWAPLAHRIHARAVSRLRAEV